VNLGFEVRVGQVLFFFLHVQWLQWLGGKIGLLCEFRDAIPLI
jgi:hypothetical protein